MTVQYTSPVCVCFFPVISFAVFSYCYFGRNYFGLFKCDELWFFFIVVVVCLFVIFSYVQSNYNETYITHKHAYSSIIFLHLLCFVFFNFYEKYAPRKIFVMFYFFFSTKYAQFGKMKDSNNNRKKNSNKFCNRCEISDYSWDGRMSECLTEFLLYQLSFVGVVFLDSERISFKTAAWFHFYLFDGQRFLSTSLSSEVVVMLSVSMNFKFCNENWFSLIKWCHLEPNIIITNWHSY